MRRLAAAAFAVAVLGTVPSARQALPVSRLLQDTLGFSAGDLRDLYRGRPIARTLETARPEEVAAAGAVVVDAPLEALLDWSQCVEGFRRGSGVLQVGLVPEPFDTAAFAPLQVPADDVDDLRACEPGDCELKLTAAEIARFAREVPWGTAREAAATSAVMRGVFFDRLVAYRRGGLAALPPIVDKAVPFDSNEAFRRLAANDPLLAEQTPDVFAYVTSFPRLRVSGVTDVFYWSNVDFGMKHTLRLEHLSVHPRAGGPGRPLAVLAAVQVAASHYFRTTLDLRFVYPGPDGRLVVVNTSRSETDGLTGMFGWLVRNRVRHGARNGMLGYLDKMRATLEAGARAGGAADGCSGP
ncbi:MAG: hypothetical protein AB7O67_00625 [Vicinamibacterales bacterium]